MRRIMRQQEPLMQGFIEHEHGRELEAMSEIMDAVPKVLELVERDLTEGRDSDTGRPGMSAEQVLRALVVKQMNGYSYEELSFHLADSRCYRTFCRLGRSRRHRAAQRCKRTSSDFEQRHWKQ